MAFELFEKLEAFEIPKGNLEALADFIGLKGAIEGRKANHIKQFALLKQYEDPVNAILGLHISKWKNMIRPLGI